MISLLVTKYRQLLYRRQKGSCCLGSGGGCGGSGIVIIFKKIEFFEVFFKLPIINKSMFPFRNQLSFKLFGEFDHIVRLCLKQSVREGMKMMMMMMKKRLL